MAGILSSLNDVFIHQAEKAAPNGVATLNANGEVNQPVRINNLPDAGQPNGIATLNNAGELAQNVRISQMPDAGQPNGLATLDVAGKVIERLAYEGVAGGVATLDANGLLTAAQLGGASLTASGYQKLPSGLIIQWMPVTSTIAGFQNFPFPIAFPNALLGVAAVKNQAGYAVVMLTIDFAGSTPSALRAAHQYTTQNAYIMGYTSRVIAIGY